jgi:hypothetical protein
MFDATHWQELFRDGYTIVSGAIDAATLGAAQAAARRLNDSHPDGGWERTKNELWREIRHCPHPDFLAITEGVLHPLAAEILESVRPDDRIQFASTMPGFSARGIGRNFHIDGGKGPSLSVFNVLFGVALTPVTSDTAGGYHVLPGSHERFAAAFRSQHVDAPVHWGEVKLASQRALLPEAKMVVPRLQPGDIIVAHSFLAHGTSANTSDVRRDMIFQRRVAVPLVEPETQEASRQAFMRDPWTLFRRP